MVILKMLNNIYHSVSKKSDQENLWMEFLCPRSRGRLSSQHRRYQRYLDVSENDGESNMEYNSQKHHPPKNFGPFFLTERHMKRKPSKLVISSADTPFVKWRYRNVLPMVCNVSIAPIQYLCKSRGEHSKTPLTNFMKRSGMC